ncbi:hypothetical protein Pyn_27874 [Prunus yedoensis var. nudiflora]|uniref:Uncharacterized protein n=1 Tax=Prunus yedoensis var. nudiflora TaxID=2094558 RepID=A0A314ZFI1_PRUYE|nr:hypothetical protein Pyn_27874 [Prunus yedoensis var. nudiflora]
MEKPILFNSTSQQPFLITQNLIFLPCPSALSVCHSFQIKNSSIQFEPKSRSSPRTDSILLSCQGREPVEKDQKQGDKQSLLLGLFVGFEKLGKNLKENLSPKQKGDWKDLMLMSLSFAVYVYISQRIVCAYCAWMSMPNHPW